MCLFKTDLNRLITSKQQNLLKIQYVKTQKILYCVKS